MTKRGHFTYSHWLKVRQWEPVGRGDEMHEPTVSSNYHTSAAGQTHSFSINFTPPRVHCRLYGRMNQRNILIGNATNRQSQKQSANNPSNWCHAIESNTHPNTKFQNGIRHLQWIQPVTKSFTPSLSGTNGEKRNTISPEPSERWSYWLLAEPQNHGSN